MDGKCHEIQAEIVQTLLTHGAYVEARDHNGCTALMFAAAAGNEHATSVLLPHANVNCKDYEGHTPLEYTKNFGYPLVADLLRNAGAESEDEEDDTRSDLVVTLRCTPDVAGCGMQVTCSSMSGEVLATAPIVDAKGTTWKKASLVARKSLRTKDSCRDLRLRFVMEDGTMLTAEHDSMSMETLFGASG